MRFRYFTSEPIWVSCCGSDIGVFTVWVNYTKKKFSYYCLDGNGEIFSLLGRGVFGTLLVTVVVNLN